MGEECWLSVVIFRFFLRRARISSTRIRRATRFLPTGSLWLPTRRGPRAAIGLTALSMNVPDFGNQFQVGLPTFTHRPVSPRRSSRWWILPSRNTSFEWEIGLDGHG